MTEAQEIAKQIAKHVPLRDAAVRILEEMETAFQAEFADKYTAEKHLKTLVEDLKTLLCAEVESTGEKVPGVTLAHVQQVAWDAEKLDDVVAWCCIHAPTLLTLKGVNEVRKWYFASPIQAVSMAGNPASVLIVQTIAEDGSVSHSAVPCPFFLRTETQVRISESGIVTAADQENWEVERGE